ncbi:MAG: vitamin B12 dependent-methionine synthase activation domain-containing protein, partial [Candidatus Egerieousia sp.]|nr:vitamin B12 dependent-methionine synthase activation domain-containing protein [Candidatus Egerieousia sp.]
AEWMQEKISFNDNIIRVAIGYPMCPDHNYKRLIFNLTDAGAKLGLGLTESCSIVPSTAICGIIISHKRAKYHI